MKIKLTANCIVDSKSKKVGDELEVQSATARPLIAMGKAASLEPKEEKVELTVSIDPKELEAVKTELEGKDAEIAGLKEQLESKDAEIEALNNELAELKKSKKAK